MLPANVHHALDGLVVVDAPDGVPVDVILLVGALERAKIHHLDTVLLEVKLPLLFQYCYMCHNL